MFRFASGSRCGIGCPSLGLSAHTGNLGLAVSLWECTGSFGLNFSNAGSLRPL